MHEGFLFSISSTILALVCLLIITILTGLRWCFDLHFLHDCWCSASSCTCWPSVCPLWKKWIFLVGLPTFLLLSCMIALHSLYDNSVTYMICKYFLPFNRLPFHFVDNCLCYAEAFRSEVVAIVYSFWNQIQKNYFQNLHRRTSHLGFPLGIVWFQVLEWNLSSIFTFVCGVT